jgi:hypothetical protein
MGGDPHSKCQSFLDNVKLSSTAFELGMIDADRTPGRAPDGRAIISPIAFSLAGQQFSGLRACVSARVQSLRRIEIGTKP